MSLQDITVEDMLIALKWDPEKTWKERTPAQQEFPYGNRVAMIAPPSAGKTCVVAGLFMRAQQKVRETVHSDNPFYCRVLEGGSNIHQDISNLMSGIFPAKTRSYLGFRSSPGLLLEQKKFAAASIPLSKRILGREIRPRKQLWHKMLQLPICDLPGETLTQTMWQVRALTQQQQRMAKDIIENAIMEMRESDAYIFIMKASEVMGLGEQLETTPDASLSKDPDVSQTRMFEDLTNYKTRHGKEIKKVFVAITAWDKLARRAERIGFDILDPYVGRQTIEDFMAACYPQFYAALHSSVRGEDINYYPLYFQTVKDEKGNEVIFEDPLMIRQEDGIQKATTIERPHIIVKDAFDPNARSIWDNVRKIEYSIVGYDRLLNDVMTLAVAK